MRKILIALLTVILCIILYIFMGNGINLGVFEIPSLRAVTENNNKLNEEISSASKEADSGIDERKKELDKEYTNYLTAKNTYNELKKAEEAKDPSQSTSEIYNIEYLWTTIGNFATKHGINLEFDVTESTAITSATETNVICDLNFKCIGEYESITNFIEDLEQNEAKFSFVPENLKILPHEEKEEKEKDDEETVDLSTQLIATFKKTGVILNRDSISEFVINQDSEESDSTDTTEQ